MSTSRKQDQIRGKFLGSSAPYGYKINHEHPLCQLIVDEPSAEIVRDIYEMVLDGLTFRDISMRLQERKLSIPRQYFRNGHLYLEPDDEVKLWRIGTISNILHNQSYIGNLVQGKRRERHYKGEERHFTDEDEWIIVEDTHPGTLMLSLKAGKDHMNPHKIDSELGKLLYQHIVKSAQDVVFDNLLDVMKYARWM